MTPEMDGNSFCSCGKIPMCNEEGSVSAGEDWTEKFKDE